MNQDKSMLKVVELETKLDFMFEKIDDINKDIKDTNKTQIIAHDKILAITTDILIKMVDIQAMKDDIKDLKDKRSLLSIKKMAQEEFKQLTSSTAYLEQLTKDINSLKSFSDEQNKRTLLAYETLIKNTKAKFFDRWVVGVLLLGSITVTIGYLTKEYWNHFFK